MRLLIIVSTISNIKNLQNKIEAKSLYLIEAKKPQGIKGKHERKTKTTF